MYHESDNYNFNNGSNNNNNKNLLDNKNHVNHVSNTRNAVFILGNSIVKNLNGYLLTKNCETGNLLKLDSSVEPKKAVCMRVSS